MNTPELFREIRRLLDEGKPFALAKVTGAGGVPGVHVGDTWIVLSDGSLLGRTVNDAMTEFLGGIGRRAISRREPLTEAFSIGEEEIGFFVDPLVQPETLVVVGAGHIAVPLTEMAALAGFRVTVIDDREDYALPARFPRARTVTAAPFDEALAALDITSSTYVVLITRGHAFDRECLEVIIGKEAGYIGMIGSRRRAAAVLDALEAEGVPRERLDRVHSPIGVDIGAATPAEIAVSILAELVAIRRCGGAAGSLSRRKGRAARKSKGTGRKKE